MRQTLYFWVICLVQMERWTAQGTSVARCHISSPSTSQRRRFGKPNREGARLGTSNQDSRESSANVWVTKEKRPCSRHSHHRPGKL